MFILRSLLFLLLSIMFLGEEGNIFFEVPLGKGCTHLHLFSRLYYLSSLKHHFVDDILDWSDNSVYFHSGSIGL